MASLVFLGEILVEGLELVQHALHDGGVRQDGGAEVVRARRLPEPAAGDHADTCTEHCAITVTLS